MNADETPQPEQSQDPMYRVMDDLIPALPMPGARAVAVRPTVDEIIDTLAAELVLMAEQCVRDYGDFHLALSGGSTPEPLYERLMYDPDYRRLPWGRTHIWIVDERCVPFDDARSNFRMIRETIVDHADIPAEHVHPIHADTETAVGDYENNLKEALLKRPKGEDRLDFILLGMGGDGHTASLFPHVDALQEKHRLVRKVHYSTVDPPERVTMTYPLLNAARLVAIFVTGAGKAKMIQRIATGNDSVDDLPIKGIQPQRGELKWYLDAQAAGAAV